MAGPCAAHKLIPLGTCRAAHGGGRRGARLRVVEFTPCRLTDTTQPPARRTRSLRAATCLLLAIPQTLPPPQIQPKDILVFVRPSQISAAQCRPLERMAPAAQLFGPDTGAAARHLPFGGWGVGAAACVRPSGACDGTGCHGQAAACAQCIDARSRRAQAAGKGPDPGPCGADCPNLSKRMRRLREQWSAPGPRPQQRAPHGAGGGGGGTSVAATSETDAALLLSTEYLTVIPSTLDEFAIRLRVWCMAGTLALHTLEASRPAPVSLPCELPWFHTNITDRPLPVAARVARGTRDPARLMTSRSTCWWPAGGRRA